MNKIGKYTISGEIGKGGMGVVYRGLDPFIGRTVAIKTIRLDTLQQGTGKDEALKRFLREAQAAGNLSHPNIVTIYDVGEHEGLIYIAMEFIEGRSLENMLQQNRKFALDEIIRLFAQIGSALDYAHGKGIVHRDIKPANILVGQDLKVTLVDFGIARTSTSTMTQTGMLMGTPRYMSPEQIAGKKVDNRADIFSLGAILYELLTQHNPFEGESITTVIYKIMHAELPPVSEFNRQLPEGLNGVVKKALARDADARYRSCRDLLADLKEYSVTKEKAPTVRESGTPAMETQMVTLPEGVVRAPAAKSRKPLFFLLAAIIGLLAAVIAIIGLSGGRNGKPVPGGGGNPQLATLPESGGTEAGGTEAGKTATVEEKSEQPGKEVTVPETKPAPGPKTIPSPAETKADIPEQAETAPAGAAVANRKGFLEREFFNNTVMVQIPQGYFTIGSPKGEGNPDEHPAHKVFISDFWLGKTEVTFKQFDAFCLETGRRLPNDEGWGRGNRPVINISWEDAESYCRWLAKKTGHGFRLPREAEWEKAALSKYPWGASEPTPARVNMKGSADGYAVTAPVGQFTQGESHYGILDMAGNVWEWMADWYAPGYYQVSAGHDPGGPASGTNRAVRGGSWKNGEDLIRSANRSSERPDRLLNVLGFRVAMDYR
jgi:formylglycine-generating enzyme required for sulfatase activity/predicted Ser/Thr protein kinase